MNKIALAAAYVSIAMGILASCQTTDAKKNQFQVNGMIYDLENRPVSEAFIEVDGKKVSSTDINGHFSLSNMKLGQSYSIRFLKPLHEVVELKFSYTDASQVIYVNLASGKQLVSMAESALKESDWQKTERFLDRAIAAGYDQTETAYLRASMLYRKKEFNDAYDIIKKLVDSGEDDRYILLFAADLAQYHRSDEPSAIIYLEKYLANRYDPDIENRLKQLRANGPAQ